MIDATVRFRSVGTSRTRSTRGLADIVNDPDGKAVRRLRAIAGEATREAKRLMEAELDYPRRPSDAPPEGKERRRRDVHLIDTIRSSAVITSPTGPRIQITAHAAFRYLEKGTKPHVIRSPGHPQTSNAGGADGWSVYWEPPVWHLEGGEHYGPNGAWRLEVPHPGTEAHHFLQRAVRHALNAT